MSAFLDRLRTDAAAQYRRIVFPEAGDPRTLDAVAILERDRIVQPIVIGGSAVRLAMREHGISNVPLIDPEVSHDREPLANRLLERRAHRGLTRAEAEDLVLQPLLFGALMVDTGLADGMVAGVSAPTGDVIRAAVWCIGPKPGITTISSSFYMVVPPFRGHGTEVLTFADAGVVPDPDPAQLADIARAAVEARRHIVGDEPRVAFLSYSTRGSASGPAVEKVRRAVEAFRTLMPDVTADGELQADAALIADVAARKAPDSPIAGNANILVFPDLDAANIAYKLVQRLAGAEAIGPILQGLNRPCNDLSRGASVGDIVNVACITALQAGPEQNLPTPAMRPETTRERGDR